MFICADLEFLGLSISSGGALTKTGRQLSRTSTFFEFSRGQRQRQDGSCIGSDHHADKRKDAGLNRRFDDVVNLPLCR